MTQKRKTNVASMSRDRADLQNVGACAVVSTTDKKKRHLPLGNLSPTENDGIILLKHMSDDTAPHWIQRSPGALIPYGHTRL